MKEVIKNVATELGFAAVGVTTAEPVAGLDSLRSAIGEGRIASMHWLARDPEARCDPASILPGARSVICLAFPYGEDGLRLSNVPLKSRREKCARFARGADYHILVHQKLGLLWESIRKHHPGARARLCVDTSPILEKALAARAGLGWIGKHTILINRQLGSWFVLGEIITDLELEEDGQPQDLCGDCRACLDACPTKALIAPGVLDSRRCISYLTVEHKGSLPEEMRPLVAGGTYGCDICQEVCPYNPRKTSPESKN
jgi:epoxyqueuosine reductase